VIVEVSIGGEQPRRYRVRRQGGRVVVRNLDTSSDADTGVRPSSEVSIDWRRPQPGIYSLLVDDASYEVFIDEEEADDLAVHLVKRSFRVRATDIRRHRAVNNTAVAADGVVRIVAPIPGRVSRVLVEVGQKVERGAGIIVVEAMKMENELRAPRDGLVATVEVEEGQGVEGGALLATLE